jgi:hypothetical protein
LSLLSWTINLGFLLRENLAAIFITPSSWGSQRAGHSTRHQLFSGAINQQSGLTIGGARASPRPRPWWCSPPVAPLHLSFGVLEAPWNIWMSGFCFVQFQEYFLYNFSETQKQQKIGNWHCGISLIG